MAAFDIPLLLSIAGSLKGLVESIGKYGQERGDKFKEALKATLTAVHETNFYLAGMKKIRKHNPKQESRLAGLWTDAAVALLDFDKELAIKCEIKSDKWSDPEEWTYQEINQAKNALKGIEYKIRQLMERY
jgi:hypothetical protein